MKKRNILVLSIAVAALIISSCKKKDESENYNGDYQIENTKKTLNAKSVDENEPQIHYLVLLTNDTLSLFEVSDYDKKIITSTIITPSNYPFEDIENLKKGVEVLELQKGYEILENFVN